MYYSWDEKGDKKDDFWVYIKAREGCGEGVKDASADGDVHRGCNLIREKGWGGRPGCEVPGITVRAYLMYTASYCGIRFIAYIPAGELG